MRSRFRGMLQHTSTLCKCEILRCNSRPGTSCRCWETQLLPKIHECFGIPQNWNSLSIRNHQVNNWGDLNQHALFRVYECFECIPILAQHARTHTHTHTLTHTHWALTTNSGSFPSNSHVSAIFSISINPGKFWNLGHI